MSSGMKIKTRIAPSPTGLLHVGTARTALFNWLFAKQKGGEFILRIEDTDRERSKKEFEEDIVEGLKWLGLEWDEMYRQSERGLIYKKYIDQLVSNGKAFLCFHKPETRDKILNLPTVHDRCEYRDKPLEEALKLAEEGKKFVVRLKTPTTPTEWERLFPVTERLEFEDIIRGQLKIPPLNSLFLENLPIARDFETPLYNFAVVVDDFEMNITHIIRGEDHISNLPKQILVEKMLGLEWQHQYAHLPLILAPDRSKLSKRHGAISVNDYHRQGYLPQALVNFMAFLGWNPGDKREIFLLDKLVKEFDLERVQKGGAIFNIDKLNWLNQQYLQKMNPSELKSRLEAYLGKSIPDRLVRLAQPRLKTLADFEGELRWLRPTNYPAGLLNWKETPARTTKENLEAVLKIIQSLDGSKFEVETLEEKLRPLTSERGRGEVLWPLRAALSGKEKSPGPFELASLIGKEETGTRLRRAIKKLS